jgi:CubicO group peptidase (beta-lactamase class C family)
MTHWKLLQRTALILVFCCTAGRLAGFAAESAPAPQAPKPKTIEELQKAIQGVLTKTQVPGVGIALVTKDKVIWAGGIGKADLAANKDVTADTQFRVGSISKGFVALALLKLQEEGKIDLNTRLKEIAPEVEIRNPWEDTNSVRVVNLLEHTAGFDDMHPNELYNTRHPADIPLKGVFALFPKPQIVRWPPGTRMAYSNPGYALAGYVVEKVTGRTFEDYAQEAILSPLGMTRSSFRLTAANRVLLAQGYEGRPPRLVPYRNIYLRPAGELKSSPAEMARFVQMMLNRGRVGDLQLVRPESVSRMEEPQTTLAARAGLRNGYGLGAYAALNHAFKEYGHDGGLGGFVSNYRYLPDQGLGYVILLNSSTPGNAMEDIADWLFNFLTSGLPTSKQSAVKLEESHLRGFAGYYRSSAPRLSGGAFLQDLLGGEWLIVENGVFYRKGWLGRRETLIPVSPTMFRVEKEPEASRVFCKDENGTTILASGYSYHQRVNPWWPGIRLAGILAGLVLMLTSPLFALIWIPRKLFGRMKRVKHLSVRIAPLLAVASFAVVAFMFFQIVQTGDPGARDFRTITFCVATWAFAALSGLGLVLTLRSFPLDIHRGTRIHSLLVAIACCVVAAYLAYHDIIGLRLWEW